MTQKEGTPKVQVAAAADSESRAPLNTIIYVDGGDVATARWSGVPATCPIEEPPRATTVTHGQQDSRPAGQPIRR
jgi:hypothetical protein